MDSEYKRRLDRIENLVEDNNTMINKLYRAMRWSRAMKVVYFVIIIGASLGIFYFLQPYLDRVGGTYQVIQNTLSNNNSSEEILNTSE